VIKRLLSPQSYLAYPIVIIEILGNRCS